MASVSKKASGGWRVLWRDSSGIKRQKSFATQAEAKRYAASLELAPEKRRSTVTVEQLLLAYERSETPSKRGARSESLRIKRLARQPFAKLTLSQITRKDIQDYVDNRARDKSGKYDGLISPSTILKEVCTLSAVFSYAVKRGVMTESPTKGLDLPKPPEHRERVATDEDLQALLVASGWDGKSVPMTLVQLTVAAFFFACKTGMRSGEILALEEAWIEDRVIHLPHEATKTDSRRDVAMSQEAVEILNLVRQRGDKPKIFGALSAESRDMLWRRVRDRAGLGIVQDSEGRVIREGLNFHDSRATFATWAASPNPKTGAPRLDVLALARQTGHKNLKMLQRYYRASAATIAKMLDE